MCGFDTVAADLDELGDLARRVDGEAELREREPNAAPLLEGEA